MLKCLKDDGDFVTVGSPKYQKIWRWPNLTKCPTGGCGKTFETTAMAMEHYRETHAKFAILCEICDWPKDKRQFARHSAIHQSKHGGGKPSNRVSSNKFSADIFGQFSTQEIGAKLKKKVCQEGRRNYLSTNWKS